MTDWKTRKDGKGGQKGLKFRSKIYIPYQRKYINPSLNDPSQAKKDAETLLKSFEKAENYEKKLKIKRLTVSLSNRAKAAGNERVSKEYYFAHTQMFPKYNHVEIMNKTNEVELKEHLMLEHGYNFFIPEDTLKRLRAEHTKKHKKPKPKKQKHMNVKFYHIDGMYNMGVEGSAVEYLTDKKIYGIIATVYPFLSGEGRVDMFDRKFMVAESDLGNSVSVRDLATSREWTLPLKETRQLYLTKKSRHMLKYARDEEQKKQLIEGTKRPMKLTSRNLVRLIIKDILVPLKKKEQFRLKDDYYESAWLEPNPTTGIKHETTPSYRFKSKSPNKTYLYSTIKRGKVRVTSEKQHQLLEARKLPHTHVYRDEKGKIVKKRVYT